MAEDHACRRARALDWVGFMYDARPRLPPVHHQQDPRLSTHGTYIVHVIVDFSRSEAHEATLADLNLHPTSSDANEQFES